MSILTGESGYPNNFGWVGSNVTQTVSANTLIVSSSAIIVTSVSNTITLVDGSTYTSTGSLGAFGANQTYLMAVRIG